MQWFDRGLREISAGRAGTIETEWGAIATITNTLRIELSSGQRFRETVDCRSAAHLRVETESGPLAAMKEYRLHVSMEKDFWARTSDEVEHRFSLTSPPGVPTNYAFDGEPQHRRENWDDRYLPEFVAR